MSGPNLATQYLGLRLANPIVAASSPLTGRIETLRELAPDATVVEQVRYVRDGNLVTAAEDRY